MQQILSPMRRAITDYSMIKDGDNIVIGLSGGKDSVALTSALAAYRRFSPEKFGIIAVTIDMGVGADYSPMEKMCEQLNVEYKTVKTDIGEILFSIRKEKSPCSLCSKMRRGALNTFVNSSGANKLALAHHADDVVETMLLSLLYEGRFSTFQPVSFMDRTRVTLIRPFVYVPERDIAALVRDLGLPVVKNPCPADHKTNREYMKKLINSIRQDIPFAFDRMFGAISHPERTNLWPPRTAAEAADSNRDKTCD